jgi:hypothetical protein
MGRMVEVRWLFVLTRLQCGRGQGCQKTRKAAPIVDRVPRPRAASSRQVALGMAHDRLSRDQRVEAVSSFEAAISGRRGGSRTRVLPRPGATPAEVAALMAEGRRVAQGLDARTRRRMGL